MFSLIRKRLVAVSGCEQGLAYIEFALSVTVLLIMFYGAIEVSRYVLIVQKVEKTIDTLTDVLTQESEDSTKSATSADIASYLNATPILMSPYTFTNNGIVILTDILQPANSGTPKAQWQVCGGGTLVQTSKVAPGGTYKQPPDGFVFNNNNNQEEIVVGEIYYQFTPILNQNIVGSALVYRSAVFQPRFAPTITANNNCP